MQKIDLLYEINNKLLTEKEAQAICDNVKINCGPGLLPKDFLNLTFMEWTAYIMGIPFKILAQWRYKGWPNECAICMNSIFPENGSWYAFNQISINGKISQNVLVHWDCHEMRNNEKGSEYIKWNEEYNDVDIYDKAGRHLGSLNPTTKLMYKPRRAGKKLNMPDVQKRNILKEIYEKKITEQDAYDFYEQVMNTDIKNVETFLGCSISEWTAFIWNWVPLSTIAQWRYEGWPDICAICGKNIVIEKGEWTILKEEKINNKIVKNVIVHCDCYDKLPNKK